MRRASLLFLALLLAVGLALPVGRAPAAGPLQPVAAHANVEGLDSARERVSGLRGELGVATAAYERTWARVEAARVELDRLEDSAAALESQVADTEVRLAERARGIFMHGANSQLELLLGGDDPTDALGRAALAGVVQERETAGLEEAVAARTALDQTVALIDQQQAELEGLTTQLADQQAALEAELESAEASVVSLEATAARQRTISRAGQRGSYACPLDRQVTHFVDSWGFPRSGGRRHKGTDIMGPMGTPVYAFTDGVIARHSNSRLSGISLYLRGDDGSTYFYAHLKGYTPSGAVGTRVQAGEQIAFNGDSGNARGGAPHIHFERHPGGGSAVNPYPYLAAACF
ncbi:MAG: peptidoglycan DD-metalloendopeptidase family protein [Nitriliruptoraceae bacterium]